MFDTVVYKIHGVVEKNNTALDDIARLNSDSFSFDQEVKRNDLDFSTFKFPAHIELWQKLLLDNRYAETKVISMTKEVQTVMLQLNDLIGENMPVKRKTLKVKSTKYVANSVETEFIHNVQGTKRLTSSNNTIVWRLLPKDNAIEIEFSIPKYCFGHNLAQYIPQRASSTYYDTLMISDIDVQINLAHKRFMNFTEVFFKNLEYDMSLQNKIDRRRIEIKRLDICYNQYFKSFAEARRYHLYQQKINVPNAKENGNKVSKLDTGMHYVSTSGTTFKIYNKGAEYMAKTLRNPKTGQMESNFDRHTKFNDSVLRKIFVSDSHKMLFKKYYRRISALRIIELNRPLIDKDFYIPNSENSDQVLKKFWLVIREAQYYKTAFLKREMDRVLRYELTVRPKFISSFYKNYIFRKNCPIHAKFKKNFKEVRSIDKNNKLTTVDTFERKNHDDFKRFDDRSIVLMLHGNPIMKRIEKSGSFDVDEFGYYNPNTFHYKDVNLTRYDTCSFSNNLCKGLLRLFKTKYLEGFKIDQANLQENETLMARIEAYNGEVLSNRVKYNDNNYMKVVVYNLKNPQKFKKFEKQTAYELLTDAQKVELDLKLLSTWKLEKIVNLMDGKIGLKGEYVDNGQKYSFDEACKFRNIKGSNKSRYKKEIAKLGVNKNSLVVDNVIECSLDFVRYYEKNSNYFYVNKFFPDIKLNRMK